VPSRLALFIVVGLAHAAAAVCPPLPDPTCLPDDPLSGPFAAAQKGVGCRDDFTVDEEGRILDPAPDPWPGFAKTYGDAAVPFLEAVLTTCNDRSGYRPDALLALVAVGTPAAIAALEAHAQSGEPTAVRALLRSSHIHVERVAEMLRRQHGRAVRHVLVEWLQAHGDASVLGAVRETLNEEKEPEIASELRRALLQIEHPDGCVLRFGIWSWRTLGHDCFYTCRGVQTEIWNDAWRGPLWCPATVSRGPHLGLPNPSWAIGALLLGGMDLLLRRGLLRGVVLRRTRLCHRTVTGVEAVYVGLAWCAASLVPLGAAVMIWLAQRPH
jgi:hypothetical protein